MSEQKITPAKVTLRFKHLRQYFPKDYTQQQIEKIIFSLLETWKSQQKGVVTNDSDG